MARYIATDTDHLAIYGLGTTRREAAEDAARAPGATVEMFETLPCSPALAVRVEEQGGCLAWTVEHGRAIVV